MAAFETKDKAKRPRLTADRFKWYKRNPSKALAGMRGLNAEQRGVYCTLIELCYEQRGPLIDDDVSLACSCETHVRAYRRIKRELLGMRRIVQDNDAGTIYDERAIRELVALDMMSERQSERGKAGAAKKWDRQQPELPLVAVAIDNSLPARDTSLERAANTPMLHRISNEIKAPPIAILESRIDSLPAGGETPRRHSRRPASPRCGGASTAPKKNGLGKSEWLEQQRAILLADDDDTQHGADRKAVRV